MVWKINEFAYLDRMNKLSPKWEGPYMFVAIPYPNAYVLEDEDGKKLKNTFNVEHLKTFFA